ncbi:hypothetical protein ZWY2020_047887 [Hordeum vulgare]|nr:hypothetical protein ZWY2020_047887 [Hordeum vulgare]
MNEEGEYEYAGLCWWLGWGALKRLRLRAGALAPAPAACLCVALSVWVRVTTTTTGSVAATPANLRTYSTTVASLSHSAAGSWPSLIMHAAVLRPARAPAGLPD